MNPTEETERSSLLPPKKRKNSLTLLFEQPQPETAALNNNPSDGSPAKDHESPPRRHPFFFSWMNHSIFSCTPQELQNTFVGSTVFLLYQVVFCLAQAATITRPHATHSSTGVMAQMAALGIMTSGPVFLWELADQVPAIYPASDLFLAPFLAGLAQSIDEVLWKHGMEDNDQVFLATFGLLLSVGFMLSGLLCVLAARVKLANLGAFLPYSVLCGFFTTIGVLMWTLGFSVDVGDKVGPVVMSADWNLIRYALIHHIPSCCVGVCMHLSGPKNPLFVILLVCCTVLGSYLLLWATGTTLAEAQTQNWFFSADDLVPQYPTLSLKDYALPAPFGVWVSVWRGDVFWEAFLAGMPMMMALVLLYLVRCSLHSAALKKNIPKVTRKPEHTTTHDFSSQNGGVPVSLQSSNGGRSNSTRNVTSERKHTNKSNKAPLTLNYILEHGYGYSQLLSGLVGGIAIAPAVAASLTLFKLRAEKPPPQYASCLLVVLFYCSNFTMVQYIPKPAFSSLMVLAGLDMIRTWTYNSYFKTKAKMEWCVGPVLVVLAFTIGVLKAIFVGILVSTFIFAANFYNAVRTV
jgi:MFS superfamily sulfate permease-like transporter